MKFHFYQTIHVTISYGYSNYKICLFINIDIFIFINIVCFNDYLMHVNILDDRSIKKYIFSLYKQNSHLILILRIPNIFNNNNNC